MVRPSIGADAYRMGALVVRAIDTKRPRTPDARISPRVIFVGSSGMGRYQSATRGDRQSLYGLGQSSNASHCQSPNAIESGR
jgi:hypothetical protein